MHPLFPEVVGQELHAFTTCQDCDQGLPDTVAVLRSYLYLLWHSLLVSAIEYYIIIQCEVS